MFLLSDVAVLLVDEDSDSLDILAAHLRSEGAVVQTAGSSAAGAGAVRAKIPDVVIGELELSDLDGRALLSTLRSAPGCASLPAIALSAHPGLVDRAQALGAGFEKYLVKPTRLSDITDAICCVVGNRRPVASGTFASSQDVSESLLHHDYRWLLGSLNASTPHRYSALLRFDDEELTSLWTFDRERPTLDPFPLQVRSADTPCALVRSTREPVLIEDSERDARIRTPRRQTRMRSFLGVPVFQAGETPFAALCHFDVVPRPTDAHALDLLERSARMFQFVREKATQERRASNA